MEKIIDIAKKSFTKLKGNCYPISSLIYHVLKEEYKIPDQDNKVCDCVFILDEGIKAGRPHTINKVYGEYIDASIEQFNVGDLVFDPYKNNKKHYKYIKEVEPLVFDVIKEEYEIYIGKEAVQYLYERNIPDNKKQDSSKKLIERMKFLFSSRK